MKNFIFISPNFPTNYWMFCRELKNNGLRVLGIGDSPYEGLLPEKKGRTYTECDIGTKGAKSRGAKRIVFSNDGLIYYSDDHYQSFTLLYGGE